MTISRKEQLEILRKMRDEEIDYLDAPNLTEEELKTATLYIPPEKKAITIKLDADVLQWFKGQQPRGYQTFINAVLREYVASKDKRG